MNNNNRKFDDVKFGSMEMGQSRKNSEHDLELQSLIREPGGGIGSVSTRDYPAFHPSMVPSAARRLVPPLPQNVRKFLLDLKHGRGRGLAAKFVGRNELKKKTRLGRERTAPTAPRRGWSCCPRSPRGVMLLFVPAFVMIPIVLFLVRITGTETSPHHMVGGGSRHRPPTPSDGTAAGGVAPTNRTEEIARVHEEGAEDRPAGDDEKAPVAAERVSEGDGAAVATVDLDGNSVEDRNSTELVETFPAEADIRPEVNSTTIKFVADEGNAAEGNEKKLPVFVELPLPVNVEQISTGGAEKETNQEEVRS